MGSGHVVFTTLKSGLSQAMFTCFFVLRNNKKLKLPKIGLEFLLLKYLQLKFVICIFFHHAANTEVQHELICVMITEIYTIEGGKKDVASVKGTMTKNNNKLSCKDRVW